MLISFNILFTLSVISNCPLLFHISTFNYNRIFYLMKNTTRKFYLYFLIIAISCISFSAFGQETATTAPGGFETLEINAATGRGFIRVIAEDEEGTAHEHLFGPENFVKVRFNGTTYTLFNLRQGCNADYAPNGDFSCDGCSGDCDTEYRAFWNTYLSGNGISYITRSNDPITIFNNGGHEPEYNRFRFEFFFPASWYGNTLEFIYSGSWDGNNTPRTDFSYTSTVTLPALKEVSNLQASTDECNAVELTWDAPDNSKFNSANISYVIYRDGAQIGTASGTSTSYTDAGRTPGTEHKYEVETLWSHPNYGGQSIRTNRISATGNAKPLPPKPTNVVATDNTCNGEITVSWFYSGSEEPDNFRIYRNGTLFHVVTDGAQTSHTFTGITRGITYTYTVEARDDCGNDSGQSASDTGISIAQPALPTTVTATPNGAQIDVSFTDNATNEQGFKIRRVNTKGEETIFELEENAGTGTVTFVDDEVKNCVSYTYEVFVFNECEERKATTEATAKIEENIVGTFDATTTFTGSKGYFPDKVRLQWTANNKNLIDSYTIYRREVESTDAPEIVANVAEGENNNQWDDFEATAGKLFEYFIIAQGTCEDDVLLSTPDYTTAPTTVGFRLRVGNVSGRVTYESGVAAQNIQVFAEPDSPIGGEHSLRFDGTGIATIPGGDDFDFSSGFSVQMWVRYTGNTTATLFQKGAYELAYTSGNLAFTVGTETLNMPFQHAADSFFHVTANYAPGQRLQLIARTSTTLGASVETAVQTTTNAVVEPSATNILLGQNLEGFLDEIRIWDRGGYTTAWAEQNYTRYLKGDETNLVGYYRANEGVGNGLYDFSQVEGVFNRNDGGLNAGITWSQLLPLKSQLAFKGVTNAEGFYVISGFPYQEAGTQYTFTPVFDVHEFEPNQQVRFVTNGNNVFDEVDFIDISSFRVTGSVYYTNTFFPVEGVEILVDDQVVIKSGQLVTTNKEGIFEVDVPIGNHSISVRKGNHVFEKEGRFPAITPADSSGVFDFQEPVSGIQFFDSTLVKVAGKVVGGAREGTKPLGFGYSVNNIGNAEIFLTTEKGFDITKSDSAAIYEEEHFQSEISFEKLNPTKAKVAVDTTSGEFVAYLLPERYIIENVIAGEYVFDGSFTGTLDLRNYIEQEEYMDDPISAKVNGSEVGNYPEIDASKFVTYERTSNDTLYTFAKDTFIYNIKRDFILRTPAQIDVTNTDGVAFFGEETFELATENNGTTFFPLKNTDGSYAFGYPVFVQGRNYEMEVSVFELYSNADNGKQDRVPVSDGEIEVVNGASTQPISTVTVELDNNGKAIYTFKAGSPELNRFPSTPERHYTRPFTLAAKTGQGSGIRTLWREDNPLRAYILGTVNSGQTFTTRGPNQIMAILRDPPGTNSYTYLQEGVTLEKTESWNVNVSASRSASLNLDLGARVVTYAGSPVGGVITENEQINELEVGLQVEANFNEGGENTYSITTTRSYQTGDGAPFIGQTGDVYIGVGTNIVYGVGESLTLLPTNDRPCQLDDCSTQESNGYRLGVDAQMVMGSEFTTSFLYSQLQIESIVIPELKRLRNSLLRVSENPQSVVNNGSDPIYVSLVPADDERFGSPNYDKDTWGEQASAIIGVGPSYRIVFPEGTNRADFEDEVARYNREIKDWEEVLENNEKEKVTADNLVENISLDGGVVFESSTETSETATTTRSYTFDVNATVSQKLGFEIADIGSTFSYEISQGVGVEEGSSSSNTVGTTWGYVLSDTEGAVVNDGTFNDFHSIDIYKSADGFSPIFKLVAGATSCPHEDVEKTKYYQPGRHNLSEGSAKVEDPELTIETPIISGVPAGETAQMFVTFKNNSELGNDVAVWMNITTDDATNPNGAIVSLDAEPLFGLGVAILVPSGEAVRKLITIDQTRTDVTDYENLKLVLRSSCDPELFIEREFSVYFQPACSNVNLAAPQDQWILNSNVRPKDTLQVAFDGYDLQSEQLEYIAFQYKSPGSSQWITNKLFYKEAPQNAESNDFLLLNPEGTTTYQWDMSSLPDREYEIRMMSFCDIGGELIQTSSDIHRGLKDTKRPSLFGAPQPADGILSANDEIRVVFDEAIEDAFINQSNFTVQGVLNGFEIRHTTSLAFNGTTNYVRIPNGLDLNSRSFTVEWWQQRVGMGTRQVVFSKGITPENRFEVGFTADDKLFIQVGEQEITSGASFTNEEWQHFAITYDVRNRTISAYMNDQFVIENAAVAGQFDGDGTIFIGNSVVTEDQPFHGNFHELRLWNRVLPLADVFAQMNNALTGNEVGLMGYWQFDEAFGTTGFDKARLRHAALFAPWQVLPKGKSVAFNGSNYVEIFTGNTVIIDDENDFSIEFWFKAAEGQNNSTLFSSGKGDGSDRFNQGNWSVGFNNEGKLSMNGNGEVITIEGANSNFLDDNWYHLAITVKRRGNLVVYVNGERRAQVSSSGFGALTGANMWLGARGFKPSESAVEHDQFFEGSIDEFRIWNLTRTEDQVVLYRNAKVNASEPGLIAYYPFEIFELRQGVTFTTESLGDQWENPFGENGGEAKNNGSVSFSDETPNLKQSRPVSQIDFDWVAFENQIIITPSEAMKEAIEQTILEITVDRIQDLNENRIASPISWTAFVDRNQLKWGDRSLTIEKGLGVTASFTLDIINKGGQQEQFSISNLPPWLQASQTTGSIEPLSTLTVTFTINEGLNTGTYQEDLFLVGNSGFNEKMTLNVRVFNDIPDNWQLDPSNFQHSMNIVGIIDINSRISTDENDILAAFVGEECRGLVNLRYMQSIDSYLAFLTVYSNKINDEQLIFKIWDDSEGIVYTDVEPALEFKQNQNIGRVLTPQIFSAVGQLQAEIRLPAGWKWTSFSLNSNDLKDLDRLFDKVENNRGDLVEGIGEFAIYDPLTNWRGTLQSTGGIQNTSLYKIKLKEEAIVRYSGSEIDLDNTPIKITKGWNWIGYLPIQNLTVDEALASYDATNGDLIKSQYQFAEYIEGIGWIGSLEFMRPGDGYMLFTQGEEERSFIYPSISLLNGRMAADEIPSFTANGQEVLPKNFPDNMSMLVSIDGVSSKANGKLLAFVNGELRGVATPKILEEEARYFLTIFGSKDDLQKGINFTYWSANENLIALSGNDVNFSSNTRFGDLNKPFQLAVDGIESSPQAWDIYPNPFSQSTEIRFSVTGNSSQLVNVEVLDGQGKQVKVLTQKELAEGNYSLTWEGDDSSGNTVPNGIYLIKLQIGTSLRTLKIIKN